MTRDEYREIQRLSKDVHEGLKDMTLTSGRRQEAPGTAGPTAIFGDGPSAGKFTGLSKVNNSPRSAERSDLAVAG
jgi:hypothetical protein